MDNRKKKIGLRRSTPFRIIALGFLSLILVGACLLMLPFSSRSGEATGFGDALFTAVSATCVTGLIVKDTATYWSGFGQAVILILIQIGGMGVVTMGIAIMRLSGKKIGLGHRSLMRESISAPQVGGIVKMTGFILKTAAVIELCGACLLAPSFCREFGVGKGLLYALFHSVSAFCNAGFDLMGVRAPFSSLCGFRDDILVNAAIMLLIIVGGVGFLTWSDVGKHRFRLSRYSLQSKIVLLTSALLILLPAVYYFFFEFSDLPPLGRTLSALFQSVTARTAGFNTVDLAAMGESGQAVMICLMLIGGSPGSTAGGMKTTTFAVLFLAAVTVFGRRNDVQVFHRRLTEEKIRTAGAILFMYLFLFVAGGIVISMKEGLPLLTCLFETASAVGTVGLTLGITGKLSLLSKSILMLLMFFGRVGGLTLIYAAVPSAENQNYRMPLENITVG